MRKLVSTLLFILLSLTVQAVSADSAREFNSRGFELYKQGHYEDALEFFRKSFEADDSYHYAHYNYACTCSILLSQDVCMYGEYLEDIFEHLQKTVQLKPEYKSKIRRDKDLTALRQFYQFYLTAGYDVSREEDLLEILTSISWYGPKPGVYPASPFFKFSRDNSVRIGIMDFAKADYEYQTGHFRLEGKIIRIKLDKDEFEAELKDGQIIFKDSAFETLTDNEDLCGA
jgi:tetratricopeptide (TPR) repeat protein